MPVSKINHPVISCLLILLGLSAAQPALAGSYTTGWYRELQFSVEGDDNVSRAWAAADRRADTIASLNLGLGHASMIGRAAKLILSGYLRYSNFTKMTGMSNVSASLAARYIFETDPGFDHPWYDLQFRISHFNHKASGLRNGYLLQAGASVNRRLSGALTAHAGYDFRDLTTPGPSGISPFDVSRHEFFVGADYGFTESVSLYGKYTFSHGTFTSSAAGTRLPDSWGYDRSSRDTVFEACSGTGCTPWWAYRYPGNMNAATLGLAFVLDGVNYDLSGRYANIRSDTGRRYHAASLLLGAIWDF